MTTPSPRRGVVTLSVLDVRRRPDHTSEMGSQLMLGETISVLSRSRARGWWKVRNDADGYVGWVRAWGVRTAASGRVRRWAKLARGRIVVPFTQALTLDRKGHLAPLVWNSRLIVGLSTKGWRRIELPDGRRGWAPSRAFETRPRRWRLLDRIGTLLGVPYVWGGRTPFGFDCSGWTQQVMAEQGVSLPRDAHDQFRACNRLRESETPRLGDLVFFGLPPQRVGHVGIYLGGGYYGHCRGMVRLNSILSDNPLYDKALFDQIRAFGRPFSGPNRLA